MPAPINPLQLDEVLRPFGMSRLLPREAYTDPAVFAWEHEHFLRNQWVCIARGEEIANRGDQKAISIGKDSVLIVRGDDLKVRAFANACRHRGHQLLPCEATANARAIVCPYHAWGYGLDGTLKAAPNFREVPGFDTADYPLLNMACEEWHGYVFLNASGTAAPLSEQLGELEAVIANYNLADLVTKDRHEYVVASNWKVLSENYAECYHCPTIHPELCAVSPPDSGGDYDAAAGWIGGWMELIPGGQTMSLDGSSQGQLIPGLTAHEAKTVGYLQVFPNLLISLHPDYVMTHKLTPLSPGETHIECTWAFPRVAADQPGFDPAYAVDFWDITNRQDWTACESVQAGLASPQWTSGPIAPMESTVYRFETMVARGYLDQPLVPQPC